MKKLILILLLFITALLSIRTAYAGRTEAAACSAAIRVCTAPAITLPEEAVTEEVLTACYSCCQVSAVVANMAGVDICGKRCRAQCLSKYNKNKPKGNSSGGSSSSSGGLPE